MFLFTTVACALPLQRRKTTCESSVTSSEELTSSKPNAVALCVLSEMLRSSPSLFFTPSAPRSDYGNVTLEEFFEFIGESPSPIAERLYIQLIGEHAAFHVLRICRRTLGVAHGV